MGGCLQNLRNKILELNHSPEEWKGLRKEFESLVTSATEDELQEFADCGAGEALYMATTAP